MIEIGGNKLFKTTLHISCLYPEIYRKLRLHNNVECLRYNFRRYISLVVNASDEITPNDEIIQWKLRILLN